MNISFPSVQSLAELFRLLGQPVRTQILLVIGKGEACVCHIEAVLGVRQSTISQHLMVLREADLVAAKRDGRNIFYTLATPVLLDAVYQVAMTRGITKEELARLAAKPVPGCPCPACNPHLDPELTCQKIRKATK